MSDLKAELSRVENALEDAKKKLYDLVTKPVSRENKSKIVELQLAIKVGTMYRDKIKVKC